MRTSEKNLYEIILTLTLLVYEPDVLTLTPCGQTVACNYNNLNQSLHFKFNIALTPLIMIH